MLSRTEALCAASAVSRMLGASPRPSAFTDDRPVAGRRAVVRAAGVRVVGFAVPVVASSGSAAVDFAAPVFAAPVLAEVGFAAPVLAAGVRGEEARAVAGFALGPTESPSDAAG